MAGVPHRVFAEWATAFAVVSIGSAVMRATFAWSESS